jgi:hypothetical protein
MDSRPSLANEPSVRALRDAMQSQLAETTPTNVCSPELTHAIRVLCAEARTRGFRAEELVLLFKSTWASLSVAAHDPLDPRRATLLERAITLGIKSYYSTAD